MNSIHIAKAPVLLIIALCLAGCGDDPTPPTLITSPGQYLSPEERWKLRVWNPAGPEIKYEIFDTEALRWYRPNARFSTGGTFFFFWESESRLWCYGSDIGVSSWMLPQKGFPQEIPVGGDDPSIEQMPDVFYNNLPEAIRKKWDERRNS